ncbi:RhoGAP-domain-containing protein [Trichodelitschia bisporula]|uniref:RhoGAP-domain-containing protein n=1 Tax=Trichodelitschia bisporula TaxID=703511 RepID=A0A6G1I143_9PEZI|nr:RhoGAP-domain-containing protein [Trichodelitschia bisporula]
MGLESPGAFPDSPTEQDEVVYPCKGCGEILEEGKAFELAGNRWHIDCFRCNTCNTLLDSDANLLLLGDGSLICNNCTYSCSTCGSKIEDLAILTGDQAYCASCFRCRNCKRRIENLRYARTSQGIFCMSCHESVMARRRKNKKAAAARAEKPSSSTTLNKSLPELPRQDPTTSTFSSTPDTDTPPSEKYNELDKYGEPTEATARTRSSKPRKDVSVSSFAREASPAAALDESRKAKLDNDRASAASDSLTLPASTYKANRASTVSKSSALSNANDVTSGDDGLFVPFVLDPNPAATSPATNGRDFSSPAASQGTPRGVDASKSSRDYFTRPTTSSSREALHEKRPSRSSSTERKPVTSPHIAYQEKGRQPSDHLVDAMRRRKDIGSSPAPQRSADSVPTASPAPAPAAAPAPESRDFKLQEVPKSKRAAGSRKSSASETRSPPNLDGSSESRTITPRIDIPLSGSPPEMDFLQNYVSRESQDPEPSNERSKAMTPLERPKRGDSLAASMKQALSRRETSSGHNSGPSTPTAVAGFSHERKASTSSQLNGGKAISNPIESSVSKSVLDAPPARSSSRPGLSGDTFTTPRAPPNPPPMQGHRSTASASHVDAQAPLNLPRYSAGADFSLEEDLDRILSGDDKNEPGVLRKVSNVVRHGRSFSDRGTRSASSSQKWAKSPLNGSLDISSPTSTSSPDTREENILLRNQLRQAQQRIATLEADKHGLQAIVDSSADISQVNTELKEKRSTMAFLDTQREIVVRELEVMTETLKKAKDSGTPLEFGSLKSEILLDLHTSLQRLKDNLSSQIEDLIQKKNELTTEIANLIQMKDKGFQEYESLSARNTQLAQHNNELIQNIQGFMKANARQANGSFDGGRPLPNGLGLYIAPKDSKPETPVDLRTIMGPEYSTSTISQDNESETTVLATPHVVKIGKGKPNMLKKGTQGFVKGLRNIRGNMAERERGPERGVQFAEGVPYNQLPADGNPPPRSGGDPGRQKFGGFFGTGEKSGSHGKYLKPMHNSSTTNLSNSGELSGAPSKRSATFADYTDSIALFGSDLTVRCEHEKRVIPSIVSRCIEEVELRGMDVEGIYRKSGGSGQVNIVKGGFEKDNDYDISDPDLDIHAVTSTLKQYFRRLPTPLITFDVYDQLLEASRVEDVDKRAVAMRDGVNALPRCHRDCLEFLVFHLARVIAHESENLMTPLNLAVVFAPTIMRPQSIEREMTDMQSQRITVQSLLEMNKTIFETDS